MAAESKEQPFVIEYYYKAKWGHAEEFLALFKKNHYPVLKKEIELGRMLKVSMTVPRYHTTEDGRWDYRVTIVFKNAAIANDNFDSSVVIKQLYPTRKPTRKKNNAALKFWMHTGICQSRMWIWRRADFLGIRVPCTGDLPADRQSLRRHFVAPASSRLPSCLSRKPPPRWRRYEMTSSTRSRGYLPHLEAQEAITSSPFASPIRFPENSSCSFARSGKLLRKQALQGIQGRAIFLVCADYAPY